MAIAPMGGTPPSEPRRSPIAELDALFPNGSIAFFGIFLIFLFFEISIGKGYNTWAVFSAQSESVERFEIGALVALCGRLLESARGSRFTLSSSSGGR